MSISKKNKSMRPVIQKFDWKWLLNYRWIAKNIPFFLFLALLTVAYIFNGHYADKLTRKTGEAEKHIKELQYQYKTIKSEVIYRSKASELVRVVTPLGLRELTTPPVKWIDSTGN